MNKVILTGFIGGELEIKNFDDSSVANFSLASEKSVKKNNQYEKVPVWHSIRLWNHEDLLPFLTKGSKILVDGELTYDEWEDNKSGLKITKAIIRVISIELLRVKNQDGSSDAYVEEDVLV